MFTSQWEAAIRARFADRPLLADDDAYAQLWAPAPRECWNDLFRLIEEEYGLPRGAVRPEDPLSKLFDPVPSSNPLKWYSFSYQAGEAQGELEYQLGKRLRGAGDGAPLRTFEDLVRAWCA